MVLLEYLGPNIVMTYVARGSDDLTTRRRSPTEHLGLGLGLGLGFRMGESDSTINAVPFPFIITAHHHTPPPPPLPRANSPDFLIHEGRSLVWRSLHFLALLHATTAIRTPSDRKRHALPFLSLAATSTPAALPVPTNLVERRHGPNSDRPHPSPQPPHQPPSIN